MMKDKENTWHKLLSIFEHANHLVKEGDWYEEDKNSFYQLKDAFLNFLLKKAPLFLNVRLSYVPYFRYCTATKDKAGALMRRDTDKKPFEYYLSQVGPGPSDAELPDKATIEIDVGCDGRQFNFHIPVNQVVDLGIDVSALPKKAWISGKEFHRKQLNDLQTEIKKLFTEIGI